MICDVCGRDLEAIGQDNMSYKPGIILCEDCASGYDYASDPFMDEMDEEW